MINSADKAQIENKILFFELNGNTNEIYGKYIHSGIIQRFNAIADKMLYERYPVFD